MLDLSRNLREAFQQKKSRIVGNFPYLGQTPPPRIQGKSNDQLFELLATIGTNYFFSLCKTIPDLSTHYLQHYYRQICHDWQGGGVTKKWKKFSLHFSTNQPILSSLKKVGKMTFFCPPPPGRENSRQFGTFFSGRLP